MKACRKKNIIFYCLYSFCPQSDAYSTFVHKKPNLTQIKQEFKYLDVVCVTLGPYFLYKNLLIRSFVFREINTFGVPKISKISIVFNTFVPIHVKRNTRFRSACISVSTRDRGNRGSD